MQLSLVLICSPHLGRPGSRGERSPFTLRSSSCAGTLAFACVRARLHSEATSSIFRGCRRSAVRLATGCGSLDPAFDLPNRAHGPLRGRRAEQGTPQLARFLAQTPQSTLRATVGWEAAEGSSGEHEAGERGLDSRRLNLRRSTSRRALELDKARGGDSRIYRFTAMRALNSRRGRGGTWCRRGEGEWEGLRVLLGER